MLAQCESTVRAILRSLRRSGQHYSKREERGVLQTASPLDCRHAELYVKQVAASGIADGHDGRVFQLPLR